MRLLAISIAAPMLLVSCNVGAIVHDQYKRAMAGRVKVGMTSSQVLATMGRPTESSKFGGETTWTWALDNQIANARSLVDPVEESFVVMFDAKGTVNYARIEKFVDTD